MLLVCKKSDFENDTIEDKLFLVYKDEWENDEKSEENTFDLLMTTIKNNTINLYTIHAPEYSEVDAVVIADSLPYFRKDDYMEI